MSLPKTFLAAIAACAALAPAANAATITYDGDVLVYSDENGEVNDVIASEGVTAGFVRFYEYQGASISYPTDRCEAYSGGAVDCQAPAALKAVLAGGNDEYSLGFGFPASLPVEISGGDGDDLIKDDYAADRGGNFDGGAGNDKIEAYKGADTLTGGPGDDKLYGGAGPDAVRGGEGNDELEGDKYQAASADVIDGGPGFDIMSEYSIPDSDINPPATVTQDGVADDGRPGEGDNVTGVEKITAHVFGVYGGTDGNDDIWVWSNIASGASTINGLGGNDKLTGSDHPETIDGGPGDDVIEGSLNNDTIVGGPGKDRINGDGGSHCSAYECTVPFGDDTIDARDGEVDQVECGIGNDTVQADKIDQVSPSCETVITGGGAGPGIDDKGPGVDTGKPGAGIGFALVGKATRKAVTFRVTCAAACKVAGELRKGSKTVGKRARTLLAAGSATVKVKLTKAGRKAVKKGKKANLTLKVAITDASGAVQAFDRKVTLG